MQSTGEWKLGRRPGLDGLRAVAVLLVIVSHCLPANTNTYALGVAGVSMFFTLSGFLITTLLLEEFAREGRLRLRAFWGRRVRRLLPGLVAVIVVVCAAAAVGIGPKVEVASVLAALLYVANFATAAHADMGALGHTWTLAMEEQFYLVWPLVVALLARRPRLLLALCLAGVVGSVALRWTTEDWFQNYFSTATRGDAILVGCALAVVIRRLGPGRARPRLAAVAVAATLPLGCAYSIVQFPRAELTLVPWLTALAIFAVVRGSYAGVLTWGPLRAIGHRSYGLYLWHFPIIMVGLEYDVLPWVVRAIVLAGLSFAAAWLSWRFVEQPFLRRGTVAAELPVRGRVERASIAA